MLDRADIASLRWLSPALSAHRPITLHPLDLLGIQSNELQVLKRVLFSRLQAMNSSIVELLANLEASFRVAAVIFCLAWITGHRQ